MDAEIRDSEENQDLAHGLNSEEGSGDVVGSRGGDTSEEGEDQDSEEDQRQLAFGLLELAAAWERSRNPDAMAEEAEGQSSEEDQDSDPPSDEDGD